MLVRMEITALVDWLDWRPFSWNMVLFTRSVRENLPFFLIQTSMHRWLFRNRDGPCMCKWSVGIFSVQTLTAALFPAFLKEQFISWTLLQSSNTSGACSNAIPDKMIFIRTLPLWKRNPFSHLTCGVESRRSMDTLLSIEIPQYWSEFVSVLLQSKGWSFVPEPSRWIRPFFTTCLTAFAMDRHGSLCGPQLSISWPWMET